MRKIILSMILLIVPGCSAVESLQSANTQNLLIDTPHVEGAECAVSDKSGRKWNLWETPGAVAIQEGHPPLVIICTKKGFKKSVLTINEHKEELLTIDGKRVDFSLYGDFPTKFPRLIPTAIKEVAGFAQDPTGHISTTYPDEVVVWMEPKKWESEEQMREWAFDRQVQDNSEAISEEDAKLTDDQRKAKRRADKERRDAEFHNVAKNLKSLNPAPAIKKGFENTTKVLNPAPLLSPGHDTGVPDAINPSDTIRKGLHVVNPSAPINFLDKRNKTHQKNAKEAEDEDKLSAPEQVPVQVPQPTVDSKKKDTIDPKPVTLPLKTIIVPDITPSNNSDGASPQDLFDGDTQGSTQSQTGQTPKDSGNIQYDDKGNRIPPWKLRKENGK